MDKLKKIKSIGAIVLGLGGAIGLLSSCTPRHGAWVPGMHIAHDETTTEFYSENVTLPRLAVLPELNYSEAQNDSICSNKIKGNLVYDVTTKKGEGDSLVVGQYGLRGMNIQSYGGVSFDRIDGPNDEYLMFTPENPEGVVVDRCCVDNTREEWAKSINGMGLTELIEKEYLPNLRYTKYSPYDSNVMKTTHTVYLGCD
jgi:hypothetical protein